VSERVQVAINRLTFPHSAHVKQLDRSRDVVRHIQHTTFQIFFVGREPGKLGK
jgi:hypothetical protein